MLRLAANLSMLFTEVPLEDRFARAAAAGFRAVEVQFPYSLAKERVADLLAANGLSLTLINLAAGDLQAGERGLALEGGTRFDAAVAQALDYAGTTDCAKVHAMIGNGALDPPRLAPRLKTAARRFAERGITMLLEPLNRLDEPAYALTSLAEAEALRAAIGEANVRIQFDAYHAARSGLYPRAAFAAHRNAIGHVQVADPPDRGEPTSQTMQDFLGMLEENGWPDPVGAEYRPRSRTEEGLDWAAPWFGGSGAGG